MEGLTQLGIVGMVALLVVKESFSMVNGFLKRNGKDEPNLLSMVNKLTTAMIDHNNTSERLLSAIESNSILSREIHKNQEEFWRDMLNKVGK